MAAKTVKLFADAWDVERLAARHCLRFYGTNCLRHNTEVRAAGLGRYGRPCVVCQARAVLKKRRP